MNDKKYYSKLPKLKLISTKDKPYTWLLWPDDKEQKGLYWGFITISGKAIMINGDCGNLVLKNSFSSNKSAFEWAKNCKIDQLNYILEKSGHWKSDLDKERAKDELKELYNSQIILEDIYLKGMYVLEHRYECDFEKWAHTKADLDETPGKYYPSHTVYCTMQLCQWAELMRKNNIEWDDLF